MMRKAVVGAAIVVVVAGFMVFAGAGCASRRENTAAGAGSPAQHPAAAAAHDPDDPAYFTLDQIQPPLQLAKPKASPTTAPKLAPLNALEWYAKAHAALAHGDRNTAINLLEKAV